MEPYQIEYLFGLIADAYHCNDKGAFERLLTDCHYCLSDRLSEMADSAWKGRSKFGAKIVR